MNWIYKGVAITELPKEVRGMVYKIYYTDETMYIGSKVVRSEIKKKPLKGMRSNAVRKVLTESKWKTYEGSSKLSKGKTIKTKVIMHLTKDKRSMTYLEQKELMAVNATVNKSYLNENIGGKFFDNCLDGVLDYNPKEACLFGGDYD